MKPQTKANKQTHRKRMQNQRKLAESEIMLTLSTLMQARSWLNKADRALSVDARRDLEEIESIARRMRRDDDMRKALPVGDDGYTKVCTRDDLDLSKMPKGDS